MSQAAHGGIQRQCRHPGCNYTQAYFPDGQSDMICQMCSRRTCIRCDTVPHPGISCSEQDVRKEAKISTDPDHIATKKFMASETKICPNCEVPGIRYEGCAHLTCEFSGVFQFFVRRSMSNLSPGPKCSHEYCWECLADWMGILRYGCKGHAKDCRILKAYFGIGLE